MQLMLRATSMVAMLLVLPHCVANGFRPPPHLDVERNLVMECLTHFDTIRNFNADGGRCEPLGACARDQAERTYLGTYPAWRPYERVMETENQKFTPVAEMRANAEAGTAKMREVFGLIVQVRKTCLARTGLTEELGDG
ncbi:hypothetical protein FHY55_01285 [Oceanicola sp. D3]|uniref:hypothetical protein n=1 Tax=Oceanicola sp. D3 TaxID=2587163 RepID=UPI00111D694D|nr:hypothetical protein [Oceanicola sp. D3]QDC07959.1 hypothetical protein FHY55_01285 [Oceanicola sp. D3]